MQQFKRVQVIKLPTENNNKGLYLNPVPSINILHYANRRVLNSYIAQHLYILSDDEIKEGDYFLADNRLNTTSNKGLPNWVLCKCTKVKNSWVYCNEIPDEGHNGDWCKKIIATTNTSLTEDKRTYISGLMDKPDILPQPSQQFIEKYIESYNKGEVITDVLVEYEDYDWDLLTSGNTTIHQRVKVNSKDNTITIKKLKTSWNREEMINKLKKFNCSVEIDMRKNEFDKWIEENL